jgi:hypothetical protein
LRLSTADDVIRLRNRFSRLCIVSSVVGRHGLSFGLWSSMSRERNQTRVRSRRRLLRELWEGAA